MPANLESKRRFGLKDLLNVESIGSAIFLVVVGCFCFLVIIVGLSHIHSHLNNEVFQSERRVKATRAQQEATDLCGVPVATGTQTRTAR